MKVLISAAAGCVAYHEGDNLHFRHLAGDKGWEVGAPYEARHIFLAATDVVELEVADRDEADAIAQRRTKAMHALGLLEVVISTQLASAAGLAASYLEGWLADDNVRDDIEKYCFATPVPDHIHMRSVIARTTPPRTKALLEEISDAQPRIKMLTKLTDRHFSKATNRSENMVSVRNALVGSGAFKALVLNTSVRPEDLLPSQQVALFRQMQDELQTAAQNKSFSWREAWEKRELILVPTSMIGNIAGFYYIASHLSELGPLFDEIKVALYVVVIVLAVFAVLAVILTNRDR